MPVPPIAAVGALIGDPARALMLCALMDGRARTASELASEAGVSRPTASAHLTRLTDGALLARERQGRHRYFRLRSPEVAQALETLMVLGGARVGPPAARPRSPERDARTCYDHLAGRLGVALLDALGARGHLTVDGARITLSPSGEALAERLGIALGEVRAQRRPFARLCLDWSERRHHLAGALGAAFLERFLARGWIRRADRSRAVIVTGRGASGFRRELGIAASDLPA